MPELPEVETIRNNLVALIKGLTINRVDILRESTILGNSKEFKETVEGKIVEGIDRIGKFMIFLLSDNVAFISHLRMEGKYYKLKETQPDSYYSRVVFHLSDGTKLCYDDSRCFGIMKLTTHDTYKSEKEIAKLGPEPFAVNDAHYLLNKAKGKSIPVKTFLLDQTVMTGLGNIYVDETLFACGIHPLTKPSSLSLKDWENVLRESKRILNQAIVSGGSTIRSYHPGEGLDGKFQVLLKVYGKVGETCPTCHHPFRKIRVGGRGTTFCPVCQPYKGSTLNVGICGPISSGKSTVTNIFKENGYDTISADDIVHDLYKDPMIAANIEKLLGIKFPKNEVDVGILRTFLFENIQYKRRLERYIHPLVAKRVEEFLKSSITKIKVAEIPLLYEAKMEAMFDVIIVVTSKNAEKLLIERNSDYAESMMKINSTNTYEKYKKEADIVINNDKDLASLNKVVQEIISKDLEMRLD